MGMVDGKVCLVTGGASNPGLGHAIAHKLADEGAIVIVTDIDGEGAATTAAEIVAEQQEAWAPVGKASKEMAAYARGRASAMRAGGSAPEKPVRSLTI